MEIEYDGFQGVTRRVIEPASFDGRYLTAYCRLRQDQRVFNTAKILSARLIAE
jgi:predicted DNA-binding transcriptional regulator YafY